MQVADSAEGSGKTVEAAAEVARMSLGVARDQIDVEVLEEPVIGSFGVVGRPARVRVTVRDGSHTASAITAPTAAPATTAAPAPTAALAPVAGGGTSFQPSGRPSGPRPRVDVDPETAIQQAEAAGDFIEELLELLDLEADITTWGDPSGGYVDVEGPDLTVLVGKDGEVLTALEELTRLAVVRQTGDRARVSLDIDGHKRRRREVVATSAHELAERVLRDGAPGECPPMTPYERKIVHDVIADIPGLHTESIGEEPRRRVMVVRD